jgi:hypothetical protein
MSRYVMEIFPESFNQLRKQLYENHRDLWAKVGYNMLHNQLQFLTDMNAELDVFTLPEMGINEVCEKYLAALAKRQSGRPARKSLELLNAEATGRVIGSTQHIFGTPDDDEERADKQAFEARKEAKTGIILLPASNKRRS